MTTIVELSPLPFAGAAGVPPAAGTARPSTWRRSPPTRCPPRTTSLRRQRPRRGTPARRSSGCSSTTGSRSRRPPWIEQIALAMTGHRRRGRRRGVARARPVRSHRAATLRVLDHVGRPAAGASSPGGRRRAGTSTVDTDASGALPLPAGDVQLTLAGRPARARALRARPRRPRRPRHQHAARRRDHRPGRADQRSSAAARRRTLVRRPAAAARPRPRPRPSRQPARAARRRRRVVPARCWTTSARPPGPAAAPTSRAGRSTTSRSTSPTPSRRCSPILVRGPARGGRTAARFLMDKYLVFRPDAPTDAIDRLVVLLLTAGSTRCSCSPCSTSSTSTTRGFLALVGARSWSAA